MIEDCTDDLLASHLAPDAFLDLMKQRFYSNDFDIDILLYIFINLCFLCYELTPYTWFITLLDILTDGVMTKSS